MHSRVTDAVGKQLFGLLGVFAFEHDIGSGAGIKNNRSHVTQCFGIGRPTV